jgi:hypothetical protein
VEFVRPATITPPIWFLEPTLANGRASDARAVLHTIQQYLSDIGYLRVFVDTFDVNNAAVVNANVVDPPLTGISIILHEPNR